MVHVSCLSSSGKRGDSCRDSCFLGLHEHDQVMNCKEKSDQYWLLLAPAGLVPGIHNNPMSKGRKFTWNERRRKKLWFNALGRLEREWLSSHPARLYTDVATSCFPWKILTAESEGLYNKLVAKHNYPYIPCFQPKILTNSCTWFPFPLRVLWLFHAAIYLKYHDGAHPNLLLSLLPQTVFELICCQVSCLIFVLPYLGAGNMSLSMLLKCVWFDPTL